MMVRPNCMLIRQTGYYKKNIEHRMLCRVKALSTFTSLHESANNAIKGKKYPANIVTAPSIPKQLYMHTNSKQDISKSSITLQSYAGYHFSLPSHSCLCLALPTILYVTHVTNTKHLPINNNTTGLALRNYTKMPISHDTFYYSLGCDTFKTTLTLIPGDWHV